MRKRKIRKDQARECPDFAFPKQESVKVRKTKKATVPEANLQSFANSYLEARNIPFIRLRESLLTNIFKNPEIPAYIKKNISEDLKGLPDNICILPITPKFNLAAGMEIKTDVGKQSKGQKDRAREFSIHVCRSHKEIEEYINKFIWLAARLQHDLADSVERLGL